MTIYSTSTYQACNPELSDKVIYGIACKQTDQAHLYDADKLFINLLYDLSQPSTIQVMIQNNLLMDGYDNLSEFAYFMSENNDFALSNDLIQPFKHDKDQVYLITAYRFDNEVGKAEMVTHEAEYSPSHLYFTSNLQCASNIVGFLLSTGTNTGFLKIEKTTVENAKYQINKRLDYVELLKPHNNDVLGHAGDYWGAYQLYTNCGTEHARFDSQNYYTKAQAQQALKDIKEMNWHSTPKTLVVQGCILMNIDSQEREYKQALIDIDRPYDFTQGVIPNKEHATWVIESYKHSQSIRQAITSQERGGHS
ncbi:TPA: hypothetical protein PKT69_002398 [Acinetobacter baumannii]|jgi:hypothetical protein|nr:hypothetical protein [Acinetobacter baumannii]